MHHFVKLLVLKQPSPVLLFGFCAPTRQQIHAWRRKTFNKNMPVLQYTAILDQLKTENFLQAIGNNIPFKIQNSDFLFKLSPRPQVLSDTSGHCYETNKPVAGLHSVVEFWALDKAFLLCQIEHSFAPLTGRKLKENMQQLFALLNQECGIDFTNEGGRLGNFEYYVPAKNIDSFEVCNVDDSTICLQKTHIIPQELIVNCAFENDGRWVDDCISIFPKESDYLTFSIDEPVTHYRIKVWEKESGILVYASECAFISEVQTNFMLVKEKIIQDPWTKELLQSASKHGEAIQDIERVKSTSGHDTIHVKRPDETPWRTANLVGQQICSVYKKTAAKGAFIPKTADKKGEIDSFQQIRKYISEAGLKKIVLADPYFSAKSAGKILARIPSKSLEFQVITALSKIDPDTGKANANAKEECKEFMKHNRNVFHENLLVQNVLRGTKAALHDRYLIRYFTSGRIDGFLLSNSLNSAGQSFPYVIAPFEPEVCLSVAEYLKNLTDFEYQSQLPKNEKVDIEILCSPIEAYDTGAPANKPILPFFLAKNDLLQAAVETCVAEGYFETGSTAESFTVLPDAIPRIIPVVFEQWLENPDNALIAIGQSLHHSYPQDLRKIKDVIQSIPNAGVYYLETISRLAGVIEERQNHHQKPTGSSQFEFWSIMNENAKVGSTSHLVDDPSHVYYAKEGYWSSLYELLWFIDPKEFVLLMESVKSPLMLSVLLPFIALAEYEQTAHQALLNSKWNWIHDLAAEWLWRNWKHNKFDLLMTLESMCTCEQLNQSAYILSRAAFYSRMLPVTTPQVAVEEGYKLCQDLIECIVNVCNETDNSVQQKTVALNKVKDVEATSNAWLLFSIAEDLENTILRNTLLDRIINDYCVRRRQLPCDPTDDQLYLEYVARSIHLRYGVQFSGWLSSKVLDWNAYSIWSEPYLRDRDFTLWNESLKVVKWDKQLLVTCQNLGYKLDERQKR